MAKCLTAHTYTCTHTLMHTHTHSPPVTESNEDDTQAQQDTEEEGNDGKSEGEGGEEGGEEVMSEEEGGDSESVEVEDEPGMWEETFKTHSDSKPYGEEEAEHQLAFLSSYVVWERGYALKTQTAVCTRTAIHLI